MCALGIMLGNTIWIVASLAGLSALIQAFPQVLSLLQIVGGAYLLWMGIGDTIRVSLSADPVEEVKVGFEILKSLGLRTRGVQIISCPSCARQGFDVIRTVEALEKRLEHIKTPMSLSVLGCVVNGPGEAREADLGVASGNGKGQIFVKGEVIRTVPEDQIVETLIEEAMRIAEEMGEPIDGEEASAPSVTAPMMPRPPAVMLKACQGFLPSPKYFWWSVITWYSRPPMMPAGMITIAASHTVSGLPPRAL